VRRGRLAIAVVVAALILLAFLGAQFYMTRLRGPAVSEDQATRVASVKLKQQVGIGGWTLINGRYDPAPDKIYDDNGHLIGSESRSSCRMMIVPLPTTFCHAHAAWILHLQTVTADSYWDAYVVVNADTGQVSSSSAATTK
jgi:hypothetical protein